MGKKTKLIYARDIAFLYSNAGMISRLRSGIMFSNIRCEEDGILEPCSRKVSVNMDTFSEPFILYSYFHLPVIQELMVLIPFTSFEIDFLVTSNVPLLISPLTYGVFSTFFMLSTVRVFISFSTKILPNNDKVTLRRVFAEAI